MGLFSMLAEEDKGAAIPIPKLSELCRADLMLMEKETTGIYLSGHPMDDYRPYLKNTRVVQIRTLMDEDCPYQDEQIVSVAGIVQTVKMKTTRNHSMMAYVTLEDDTAAVEMLAFSNVLSQYGGYLRENSPVVVTGRFSQRDDKDPQIIVNRVRPITDYSEDPSCQQEKQISQQEERPRPAVRSGTLYLRLPTEAGTLFAKIRAIIHMFPGESQAVVYFADTKCRRGASCALDERMLSELRNVLGEANVVVK